MDTNRLKHFIEAFWEDSILPSITEYIRIPNKSPAFDPLRIEGRRFVGNADVFRDRGQDRVFPEGLDEMLQAVGVHARTLCQMGLVSAARRSETFRAPPCADW